MFKWFKRVLNDKPIDPGYKDDWEIKTGKWEKIFVCHCGRTSQYGFHGMLCDNCGHSDKWEEIVSRTEWMHSESRRAYWRRWLWTSPNPDWPKPEEHAVGYKLVRWTEDHCPVKDEAKPIAKRTTTTTKKRKKP